MQTFARNVAALLSLAGFVARPPPGIGSSTLRNYAGNSKPHIRRLCGEKLVTELVPLEQPETLARLMLQWLAATVVKK
jgi:hypothetical protein